MSLLPLLTVLFIGLKLADIIMWSWWWVLAPTWIPLALLALLGALLLTLTSLLKLLDQRT